jgi:hypothetical protein
MGSPCAYDGVNTHGYEPLIPLEALVSNRPQISDFHERSFCALVAGNPDSLRMNLYGLIDSYKHVDGYGKLFGRPVFASKFDFLKGYKFCLCPENSYFPGYVTEKLFDAWYAGTLPLYCGSIPKIGLINESALLNYSEAFQVSSWIALIKQLDLDEERYNNIYTQPLLSGKPSLEGAVKFMRMAINSICSEAVTAT